MVFKCSLSVFHDFNEVHYSALVFGVVVEENGAADGRQQTTDDDDDDGRTTATDDDRRRRTPTTTDKKRRRSDEFRAIPDFKPRGTGTQMTPDHDICSCWYDVSFAGMWRKPIRKCNRVVISTLSTSVMIDLGSCCHQHAEYSDMYQIWLNTCNIYIFVFCIYTYIYISFSVSLSLYIYIHIYTYNVNLIKRFLHHNLQFIAHRWTTVKTIQNRWKPVWQPLGNIWKPWKPDTFIN